MFLVIIAQFSTYTYITAFLSEQAGFSGTAISAMLLAYTLVGMAGNFAGGAASDKNVKVTLLSGMALLLFSLVLMHGLSGNVMLVTILIAVWGFAYGVIPIALQIWMIKAAPNAHEGGTALYVANFQTSTALGSFLGGVIIDRAGLSLLMYFGAVAAALSCITILLLAKSWALAKA